jgi:hypothetical protein
MAEVEELVGLRGRKYFGAFDAEGDEYRVCVQLRQGDDPEALRMEVGTLPGGRYARLRRIGEPPGVYGLIAPSFQALAERTDRDPSRHARDRVLPTPGCHRSSSSGHGALKRRS